MKQYDDSNSRKLVVGEVRQEGDMFHGGKDYWFPTLLSGSPITKHSSETRRPFTAANEAVAAKSEDPQVAIWVCQPNLRWLTNTITQKEGSNKYGDVVKTLQQAHLDTNSGAVEWRDVPHEEEK